MIYIYIFGGLVNELIFFFVYSESILHLAIPTDCKSMTVSTPWTAGHFVAFLFVFRQQELVVSGVFMG